MKDVCINGEGVGSKADIVREVAWIVYFSLVTNADKGRSPARSADVLNGWSRMSKNEGGVVERGREGASGWVGLPVLCTNLNDALLRFAFCFSHVET